ncbi:uncharacterized protein THITE_37317 [Thermothielavioides terrestris NRRL 8126]|uniref:C2H2-type domain-containing protein n=1 Tax=Thermothielavioides terrestris (strain ATCC 38088 / NRRL 8126) TaxID=578455 RepID=G2R1C2_THETT|nr:uncharacterized protein THITE_37317 [Thermothielavioides terrestris NRRL 8126]AEO64857.1 hypothetical protein THITE_37317 [Thermothielavioides terrestris NRRL 8126]
MPSKTSADRSKRLHVNRRCYPCHQCNRCFGTAEARSQHQRDSPVHNNPGAQTIPLNPMLTPAQHLAPRAAAKQLEPTLATPPPTATPLCYRGNEYTSLRPSLHNPLYALLLAHCLTPSRLALEKYPLPSPTTPSPPPAKPPSSSTSTTTTLPKPRAIVLDCEMAGTGPSRAREEVIVLSAIDFFTGATLLHTLVCPARPVTDWRTAITGVTARAMAAAVARGEALAGREAAVAALWTVVDSETVVVGHALWHDLRALGVSCARVVDSAVLTAQAAGVVAEGERVRQPAGLQKLCRELVGLEIREGGRGKHDSLEDVLATREVVLWCLRHPEELGAWAAENWGDKGKGLDRKGGTGRGQGGRWGRGRNVYGNGSDDDDGDEVLLWEDVVDWDMWPKSPPDWSD